MKKRKKKKIEKPVNPISAKEPIHTRTINHQKNLKKDRLTGKKIDKKNNQTQEKYNKIIWN